MKNADEELQIIAQGLGPDGGELDERLTSIQHFLFKVERQKPSYAIELRSSSLPPENGNSGDIRQASHAYCR